MAKEFKEFDMTCGPIAKTIDMERQELKSILSRAYKEFYFRPQFVIQTFKHLRDIDEIKRIGRSFRSLVKTILFHKKKSKEMGNQIQS